MRALPVLPTIPSESRTVAPPAVLTLLRHGQSRWNRSLRFTGWEDIGLSARGRLEAADAGRALRGDVPPVDVCFTSMLGRTIDTAEIALAARGQPGVPIRPCWRLNERHYGALQGLTPWAAAMRYGPRRVLRCRRRARERPPSLSESDPRSPHRDARYAGIDRHLLPHAESLRDVAMRVLPCWREHIVPELADGRHVLVVSHRNLLQVLLWLLEEEPPFLGFGRGRPRILRFDRDDARLRPTTPLTEARPRAEGRP